MQGLVYIFIALAGFAIGFAAYFGFTFTPIEAALAALVFGCVAVVALERALRRRAENRLEKAIEDLSRLLSTDAQAGAVLSQRVNALVEQNSNGRLETIEADISVLGTVVRQVAEAVAEMDEQRKTDIAGPTIVEAQVRPEPVEVIPEPVIPLEMLKQAMADNRLVHHIQPVVLLPQRRPQSYDLQPRLLLEDGELADAPDFMPRRGGESVVRRIERLALDEAITIVRRARTGGQPIMVNVPLGRATLGDIPAVDQLVMALDANRAVAQSIVFTLEEADWSGLTPGERSALNAIVKKGVSLAILNARTLRFDYAALAGDGVRSVRIDAARFINDPQSFTDFHPSDIAAYLKRFDIDLVATGIRNEQQIISFLEDGILLVQGTHIAGPGPIRPDLLVERPAAPVLRRAES